MSTAHLHNTCFNHLFMSDLQRSPSVDKREESHIKSSIFSMLSKSAPHLLRWLYAPSRAAAASCGPQEGRARSSEYSCWSSGGGLLSPRAGRVSVLVWKPSHGGTILHGFLNSFYSGDFATTCVHSGALLKSLVNSALLCLAAASPLSPPLVLSDLNCFAAHLLAS